MRYKGSARIFFALAKVTLDKSIVKDTMILSWGI
jgi:hypothetical protein